MGLTGGFIGWIKIDFEGEALKFICHTANDLHQLEDQAMENILLFSMCFLVVDAMQMINSVRQTFFF